MEEKKNYKPKRVGKDIIDIFDEFPTDFWDERDYQLYVQVKRHVQHKSLSILGYILWPLAIFWLPAILGMWIEHDFSLASCIVGIVAFSFTTPVTLPLFVVIGFYINPLILSKIFFTKKFPYDPRIAEFLRFSSDDRNKISAGAIGGLTISKILKK